jgi:hypothetical protein
MTTLWETKNRSGAGWEYEESDLLYEMADLYYESYRTPQVWTNPNKAVTSYNNPSRNTGAVWTSLNKN